MCGCNCLFFYKARTLVLILLCLGEAYLLFYRINHLFPYLFIISDTSVGVTFNITMIENGSMPIMIGFLLDSASSITAAAVGIFVLGVLAKLSISFIYICCYVCCCRQSAQSCFNGCFCGDRSRLKALQRFLSLDCNCPCYRARPSLRFRLRFAFLVLCFGLRVAAIYQYLSISEEDKEVLPILYACCLSLLLLIGTLLLDLYHYTVWWCYTPQIDTQCHFRSKKHQRYIPYHLVGEDRRTNFLGDSPCKTNPCYNRHLSHVVIFHSRNHKPQPRWSLLDRGDNRGTYIGFHTTTPEAAVLIAHSEFKISDTGMLGKGVYFARSIADTVGKANSSGACIIAEILMGRVFQFHKRSVYPTINNPYYDPSSHDFVRHSFWHDEYDTCYLNHENQSRDEFCIKDPAEQIVKWIIVVNEPYDAKVRQYGLDTEFNSTQCSCI